MVFLFCERVRSLALFNVQRISHRLEYLGLFSFIFRVWLLNSTFECVRALGGLEIVGSSGLGREGGITDDRLGRGRYVL